MASTRKHWLAVIGPGLLVAATGVGAGDLATAAFTGSKLGLAVLWAVVVGAVLKFALNEGLTRWQLATETTLLEGCVTHLGPVFRIAFPLYLVLWSYFVGTALLSACGATAHAIYPLSGSPTLDKIGYGLVHSMVALALVRVGGYAVFERVMTVCIGIMFCVVVATAVALRPSWEEVVAGLFLPRIPAGGLDWTVALLGGVGGTLTILCYGYWIREEGRSGASAMRLCRLDLASAYVMTAAFGMAMLVIGSRLPDLDGRGVSLLAELAEGLKAPFGAWGNAMKWAFLIGAWGAVFSSLLGVWQSLPYLFTDYWHLAQGRRGVVVDAGSRPYRVALWGIAVVPLAGLWGTSFEMAQLSYAIVGALVIPGLAVVLLVLNNRGDWVGELRNGWKSNATLAIALLFFLYTGVMGVLAKLLP